MSIAAALAPVLGHMIVFLSMLTQTAMIPCSTHRTVHDAFVLTSDVSFTVTNCGCFDVVYVALPAGSPLDNTTIAATGSYVSVASYTELSVLSNFSLIISNLACAYSSANFVNGSQPAAVGSDSTALPPFVALYTAWFGPAIITGSNIVIHIVNVSITEPSLGSEVNTIMWSRSLVTPWVGMFALQALENVTALLLDVTLSHGGVRHSSWATLLQLQSNGASNGHNVTLIGVDLTQKMEPGPDSGDIFLWYLSAMRFVFAPILLVASSISVNIAFSAVVLTFQPVSLFMPSDLRVYFVDFCSAQRTCTFANSRFTLSNSTFHLFGVTGVACVSVDNIDVRSIDFSVVAVDVALDVRGELAHLVDNRHAAVLLLSRAVRIFNIVVRVEGVRTHAQVISGSQFGLPNNVSSCAVALLFVSEVWNTTITFHNASIVAILANGTVNSPKMVSNGLPDLMTTDLEVSLLLSINVTRNVTLDVVDCVVKSSFSLVFNASLALLAAGGTMSLTLINFGPISIEVIATITNSRVTLVSATAISTTLSVNPFGILLPNAVCWKVVNITGLIAFSGLLTGLSEALKGLSAFTQLANDVPQNVSNVSIVAVGSRVELAPGTADLNKQATFVSLPPAIALSRIVMMNCSLVGDSAIQLASSTRIDQSTVTILDSNMHLYGSILSDSALLHMSSLLFVRCVVVRLSPSSTRTTYVVLDTFKTTDTTSLLGLQLSNISFADCTFVQYTKMFNVSNFNETYSHSSQLVLGCNGWQPSAASSSLRGLYAKDIANPPSLVLSYGRGVALISAQGSNWSSVITCPGAHRPSTLTKTEVPPPIRRHHTSLMTSVALAVSYSAVVAGSSSLLSSLQTVTEYSSMRSRCATNNAGPAELLMSSSIDNPMQIRLVVFGEEMSYLGGSFFGNLAMFAAALSSKLLAALIIITTDAVAPCGSLCDVTSRLWARNLNLPGVAWAPFGLVVQPITAAAVASLVRRDSTIGLRVSGAAFLLMVSVFMLIVIAPLVGCCHHELPVEALRLRSTNQRVASPQVAFSSLKRWVVWLISPRWQWKGKGDAVSGKQYSTNFLFRFGDVLSMYCQGRHWFFVVEGVVAMASGMVSGLSMGLPGTECNYQWPIAAAQLSLLTLLVGCVALLKPYNAPIDTIVTMGTAMLSVLSICLLAAVSDADSVSGTIGTFLLLQSIIGLLSFPAVGQRLMGSLATTLLGRLAAAVRRRLRPPTEVTRRKVRESTEAPALFAVVLMISLTRQVKVNH